MSILPEETELQKDIAATKDGILQVATAVHHMAEVQSEVFRKFWDRNPERILTELNSDAVRYATILGSNTALGLPANAQLAALNLPDEFPRRAPVTMPEGWAFSMETGFSYTAPAQEGTPLSPEELDDGPPL